MVRATRWVLGHCRAFPPYRPLVDKFVRAKVFQEASSLPPFVLIDADVGVLVKLNSNLHVGIQNINK